MLRQGGLSQNAYCYTHAPDFDDDDCGDDDGDDDGDGDGDGDDDDDDIGG